MSNQETTNLSFSDPEEDPSAKLYPGPYPNSSGYPLQQYKASGDPQGPYTQQQPYPVMSGHTGVMTSTAESVHMPDYLCYSIFTLLCCCFPLGVAAVIYSAFTRNANMAGRQDLASKSSRTALILNNVAVGVGLAVCTLSLILSLYSYGVFA